MFSPTPQPEQQPTGATPTPDGSTGIPPLTPQPQVLPEAGQLAPNAPVEFTATPPAPAPLATEAAPTAALPVSPDAAAPAPVGVKGPQTLTTREAVIILKELMLKGEYAKVVSGSNDILTLEPNNAEVLALRETASRCVADPAEAAKYQLRIKRASRTRGLIFAILALLLLLGLGVAAWAMFLEQTNDPTNPDDGQPVTFTMKIGTDPDILEGTAPFKVSFVLRNGPPPDGVKVAFDPGNGVPQQPPFEHMFEKAGTFTVNATATNLVDGTVLDEQKLTVTVRDALKASIVATPGEGRESLTVAFRATVEGPTGSKPQYLWDFGDGTTSSEPAPIKTYDAADSYTVKLTIRGTDGISTSTETTMVLEAPTVVPSSLPSSSPSSLPTGTPSSTPAGAVDAVITTVPKSIDGKSISGNAPFTVLFSSGSSSSENGTLTSTIWNFGDTTGSEKRSIIHTYIKPGLYKVKLEVYDVAGAIGTETFTVNVKAPGTPVSSIPPTDSGIDISVQTDVPPRGPAPLTVTYDASGTTAANNGRIASYEWDFGDGSTLGEGPVVEHTFQTPGKYTVRLTVTDGNGKEAMREFTADAR